MAFNISALSNWNDTEDNLAIKAIEQNRISSIPGIHIIPNVVGSVEVPFVSNSVSFSNAVCNTVSSGTTTLGNVLASTCQISVWEELCQDELAGTTLTKGFKGDLSAMPYEDKLAESYMMSIEKGIENVFINGNPTTPTQGGALCNGLLYTLDQATASTVSVTYSAWTATNAIDIVDAIYAVAPNVVREREYNALLIPYAAFDALMVALRKSNNFHYDSEQSKKFIYKMPGYTNLYVHAISSMPTAKAVLTYPENILYPNNLNKSLKMRYSEDKDKYIVSFKARIGANVHFKDHVVYYK